jgi:hypothetical protein
MSDIARVLERLVDDVSFRDELRTDPQAALAGYDLSTDDLRVLAAQVTGDGDPRPVERRTSRSALFSLLARGERKEETT